MEIVNAKSTAFKLSDCLNSIAGDVGKISNFLGNTIYLENIKEEFKINPQSESPILLCESKNTLALLTTLKSSYSIRLPCSFYYRFLYVLAGRLKVLKKEEELISIGEFISLKPMEEGEIIAFPNQGHTKILSIIIPQHAHKDLKLVTQNEYLIWNTQEYCKVLETTDGYYYGYDDRYKTVYESGAYLWETDEPNEIVRKLISTLPLEGKKIIDLGCGEGRDTIYLASQGYDVVGIDVSHNALEKARSIAWSKGLNCQFLERDVIYMRNIPHNHYDLALNMGCLHMLDNFDHRQRHLKQVLAILKPGGIFLISHCRDGWLKGFWSVEDASQINEIAFGKVIDRRVRINGEVKKIPLPLLHYKEANEFVLSKELIEVGFKIEQTFIENTFAFGNSAIVIARKPLK